MSTSFYTVVYQVDKEHRDEWWQMIQPMFLTNGEPITVISVSIGDLTAILGDLEYKS